MIKEINKENDLEITFSGIVHQEDCDCKDIMDSTSKKLKSYCGCVGIEFINNVSIDGSCLNRSKLHLNRKGSSLLTKNVATYIKLKAD